MNLSFHSKKKQKMKLLKWGFIGHGDVVKRKSLGAFLENPGAKVISVLGRNESNVKKFAENNSIAHFTTDSNEFFNNNELDAVYIATPPKSHFDFIQQALGKNLFVYVEKPFTLTSAEAEEIKDLVEKGNYKVTVAHYRRELEYFQKVQQLLAGGAIGSIRFATILILQPANTSMIAKTNENWRINPEISGGGYFHDLAPHQIDLMHLFFGDIKKAAGFSVNQSFNYSADDLVQGIIEFENGILVQGTWAFNVAKSDEKDECIIYGSEGHIKFSFYADEIVLENKQGKNSYFFERPKWIQQPMIDKTIDYFLGKAENPCTAADGFITMKIMEVFTGNVMTHSKI